MARGTAPPDSRQDLCLPLDSWLVCLGTDTRTPKPSRVVRGRQAGPVPIPPISRGLHEGAEAGRRVLTQEDGDDEPQRLFRRAQGRRQLVKAQILDTGPQPPHLLQSLSHVPVRCRRHLKCGRPPGTPSSAPRMWAERGGFTPYSGRGPAHGVRIGCGPAQCL